MNEKITTILIGVLFVTLLFAGCVTEEEIETPNQFGSWSQEILVVYTDGSTKPLALVHEGEEVDFIRYTLSARTKEIGTGSISVNMDDYEIKISVGVKQLVHEFSGIHTLLDDGEFHELVSVEVVATSLSQGLADSTYTLTITPQGTVTYGDSLPCSLPEVTYTIVSIQTPIMTNQITTATIGEGSVNLDPIALDGIYETGTSILVLAIPEEGYEFDSWSGGITSVSNPLEITLTTDMHLIAKFVPEQTPPTIEDFTSDWILYNNNPTCTVDVQPNAITITDQQNGGTYHTYLRKDFGNNYFTPGTKIRFKMTVLDDVESSGYYGGIMLTNDINKRELYDAYVEGDPEIAFTAGLWQSNGPKTQCDDANIWQTATWGWHNPSPDPECSNTDCWDIRYVTICDYEILYYEYTWLDGTEGWKMEVFSDSQYTNTLGSWQNYHDWVNHDDDYKQYLLVGFGRGNSNDARVDYIVENVEILAH